MSQPYCGIGKVPKGRIRGSMKASAEVGQVRHFGEADCEVCGGFG